MSEKTLSQMTGCEYIGCDFFQDNMCHYNGPRCKYREPESFDEAYGNGQDDAYESLTRPAVIAAFQEAQDELGLHG